ncbi:putative serine/threonine protein kinase [Blattamonas nauphoetae]|uniref:Serine/threonine protein kinase n=1 Tax=Blattamonas nauphoetae TaxID=2049346 RepID=A0ABQ9X982_9EUKA|nr:putative serine/threonine protein kinase [Blattamonas nauphoetae]
MSHDREGHFIGRRGDTISSRYEILSRLGIGTFGTVYSCLDKKHKVKVAVKVVRAVKRYVDAAKYEADILYDIAVKCQSKYFVDFYNAFSFRDFYTIVTEELGDSLYSLLEHNNFIGLPLSTIRAIAYQLFDALSTLETQAHLIHTDLKPENLLLKKPIYARTKLGAASIFVPLEPQLKIIDFGSATYEHKHHSSVICTRPYRPPEVILGFHWSYPADIWSAGCILVELFNGQTLFQTHDSLEHIALMERILGPFPLSFAGKTRGTSFETYFTFPEKDDFTDTPFSVSCDVAYPVGSTSRHSINNVLHHPSLHSLLEHYPTFYSLISSLLRFHPNERLNAAEALRHPFFGAQGEQDNRIELSEATPKADGADFLLEHTKHTDDTDPDITLLNSRPDDGLIRGRRGNTLRTLQIMLMKRGPGGAVRGVRR